MTQPGERHAKVNIVTVSYRNHADTRAFLDSLATVRGFQECNVTVVNNAVGSEDLAEIDEIAASFEGSLTMVHSAENLYYWGGAESVVRRMLDSDSGGVGFDWLIICNNDVLFNDAGFLETLRSCDASDHGVIAPSIISLATGRDQNPFLRKPPGMFQLIKWRALFSNFPVAKVLLGLRWAIGPLRRFMNRSRLEGGVGGRGNIYAPHGAFMIFSRRYFERGGWLDTTVPMYMEEITTGAIAEQIGVPVLYCPVLQVHHCEHATTGTTLTRVRWSRGRVGFSYLLRHYLRPEVHRHDGNHMPRGGKDVDQGRSR